MKILFVFWISQVAGVIGFLIFIKSIQHKEKEKVLLMQIIAFMFYSIQYLFINAFPGMAIYVINAIRCLVFYLLEKKRKNTNLFCIIFLIMTFLISIRTYEKIYDVLPLLASANSVVFMWQNNTKIIRRGQIFSCLLWIIYNTFSSAYIGILTESAVIISCIIAILKYDFHIDIEQKVFTKFLKVKFKIKKDEINLSKNLPSKKVRIFFILIKKHIIPTLNKIKRVKS